MQGPEETVRRRVADRLNEMIPGGDEKLLDALLADLSSEIGSDIESRKLQSEDPHVLLGAVESWAAVVSDVVARFYGTNGADTPRSVGWSPAIAVALRHIVDRLRAPLGLAVNQLDSTGYAITIGPPSAPMSITLSWPTSPQVP